MDDFSIDPELIQRAKEGQDEYFPVLWNKVERYVHHKSKRLLQSKRNIGADQYDLEQAGRIALLLAIRVYDPKKTVPFFTLFAYCLKTEFARACGYRTDKQRKDPINYALSLNKPITDKYGEEDYYLADVIADPQAEESLKEIDQQIWTQQLHATLEGELSKLTQKQQDVVRLYYWEGLPIQEIADRLSLTYEAVVSQKAKAMERLRQKQRLEDFLDEKTDTAKHISIARFNSDRISAVEWNVLLRERFTGLWNDIQARREQERSGSSGESEDKT